MANIIYGYPIPDVFLEQEKGKLRLGCYAKSEDTIAHNIIVMKVKTSGQAKLQLQMLIIKL